MSFMEGQFTAAGISREERRRGLLRAVLTSPRLGAQEVLVRNVSPGGIGATIRGPAPGKGEKVTIQLPDIGEVTGEVRWCSSAAFGICLDHPLDLERLGQAIRQNVRQTGPAADWTVSLLHRVAEPAKPGKVRRL